MKLNSRWLFFILALLLPILACETTYPVDPTRLAPNNLADEDFSFNIIYSMDLSGKDFSNADFAYAEIAFTNFSNANLVNTIFEGAGIGGNNFDFANLQGASFAGTWTRFDSETPSTFLGTDLRGANLDNTCFWADWTDAILDQNQARVFDMMVHGVQNWREWNLENLSNICFSTEYLKYNDLIYSSTTQDFIGIDFSGAILSYSSLSGLDLSFSNFSYAQLEESYLSSSNLEGANFSYANLFRAVLMNTNFRNSILSFANLEQTQLAGADFRGANLTGANLKGADIRDTDFLGATMDSQQIQQIKASHGYCIRLPDGYVILGVVEEANIPCNFGD